MIGKAPVLGVDVGENSVKYVLVSHSHKQLVVEQFGVVELKDKAGTIQEPLHKIFETLHAKGIKSYRTVAGISGQSVFLRFVRLPPVPKKQMDQIVCYEAQQQVPFPIEDVRWDYHVLSAPSEEERDVVLIAIKNEIVEQFSDAFHGAGLRPMFLDTSCLAIVNCLTFNQVLHPGTSSLILDIGAKTTHMIVADRGNLWIRSIPIAGNHVTQAIAEALSIDFQEAEHIKVGLGSGLGDPGFENQFKQNVYTAVEKGLARLFAEIARSLGFYRSQIPNAVVNDVYLCGGGSLLKGLDQALKDRFSLPVKRVDALAGFQTGLGVQAAELSRLKIFLAGALGLALRPLRVCRLQLDLTPHNVQKERLIRRRIFYMAAAYIVLMLMGWTYWGVLGRLANVQLSRTLVLDTSLKGMEALSRSVYIEKEQLEVLSKKIQRIEDVLLAAQTWPAIASAIADVLPGDFWIVRISANKTPAPVPGKKGPKAASGQWGSVLLEGKTTGDIDRDLPLFREALSKVAIFSDIEIVSAQVANGVVEFSIQCKVKNLSLGGIKA